MADATATTAPGLPPRRPEDPLRMTVLGHLVRDAELRAATDGSEQLTVLVDQHVPGHPSAWPVWARRVYPNQGCPATTHAVAARRARELRKGTEVLIVGMGMELVHFEGQPALHLINCMTVEPYADVCARYQGAEG